MDKIVDHLFVFEGDGVVRDFNGTYTEYRARRKQELIEERRQQGPSKEKKEKPKDEKPKMSYLERKEFNRLEKEIEKLEKRKAQIMAQFNDTSLDGEAIEKLSIELGRNQSKYRRKRNALVRTF